MAGKGFKSVTLSESVFNRLKKFREETRARSFDQALEWLLDKAGVN